MGALQAQGQLTHIPRWHLVPHVSVGQCCHVTAGVWLEMGVMKRLRVDELHSYPTSPLALTLVALSGHQAFYGQLSRDQRLTLGLCQVSSHLLHLFLFST